MNDFLMRFGVFCWTIFPSIAVSVKYDPFLQADAESFCVVYAG